jgi:SPP1 gp7 family putative phage head morphogenesis protein
MREKKQKTAPPVSSPKTPEVVYRKKLLALVKSLEKNTNELILPLLVQLEPEYVQDQYAQTLEEAFNNLRNLYIGIRAPAKIISSAFVSVTNAVNRERFNKSMQSAIGVSLPDILSNEGIGDIIVGSVAENVSLIQSIPEEYFKKLEGVVFRGTMSGETSKSLIEEIRAIYPVTENRAKLIARDQTSKVNSDLNQTRQTNLGVTEYIWRTAEDGRVRETHRENNGKTFRWDKPPAATGHPGNDVNCRCVAQAIIQL